MIRARKALRNYLDRLSFAGLMGYAIAAIMLCVLPVMWHEWPTASQLSVGIFGLFLGIVDPYGIMNRYIRDLLDR